MWSSNKSHYYKMIHPPLIRWETERDWSHHYKLGSHHFYSKNNPHPTNPGSPFHWEWFHGTEIPGENLEVTKITPLAPLRLFGQGLRMQGPAKGLHLARMSYENALMRDEVDILMLKMEMEGCLGQTAKAVMFEQEFPMILTSSLFWNVYAPCNSVFP